MQIDANLHRAMQPDGSQDIERVYELKHSFWRLASLHREYPNLREYLDPLMETIVAMCEVLGDDAKARNLKPYNRTHTRQVLPADWDGKLDNSKLLAESISAGKEHVREIRRQLHSN